MRLLAAFIVISLIPFAAAAESGARDPVSYDQDVRAIDIAGNGVRLGVGIVDAGSDLEQTGNQHVWFLEVIKEAFLSTDQSDIADDPACDEVAALTDPCTYSVVDVAVSHDAQRIVVASRGNGQSVFWFASANEGTLDQVVVPGNVVDVAISDNGGWVAAGVNPASGGAGTVYAYEFSSSKATEKLEATAGGTITAIDMNANGNAIVAIAGSNVNFYSRTEKLYTDSLASDTATSVAMSDANEHVTVVGLAKGPIRLYSADSVDDDTIEQNIRSSQPVTAVAIDAAGETIAVARDSKIVATYSIEEQAIGIGLGPIISSITLAEPAAALVMAADGSSIVAQSETRLSHHTRDGEALWGTQVKDGTTVLELTGLTADDTFSHVGVIAGGELHLFDAIIDTEVIVEHPGLLRPGQQVSTPVTLHNQGNRVDTAIIAVTGPTGWNVSIEQGSTRLLPDEKVEIALTFQVPPHYPAGDLDLDMSIGTGAGIRDAPLAVEVIEDERYSITPGAASLSITSGGTASFEATISNEGNVAGRPTLSVTGPAGWGKEILQASTDIDPGEEASVQVRVRAPNDAAQLSVGTFTLRMGDEQLEYTATVGASFGTSLTGDGGVTITRGASGQASFTVKNAGNAPDSYRLDFSSLPLGWTAAWSDLPADGIIRDLAPGQSSTHTLQLSVPAASSLNNVALTITAQSLADNDATASRTLVIATEPGAAPPEGPGNGGDQKSPGLPLIGLLAAIALAMRRR